MRKEVESILLPRLLFLRTGKGVWVFCLVFLVFSNHPSVLLLHVLAESLCLFTCKEKSREQLYRDRRENRFKAAESKERMFGRFGEEEGRAGRGGEQRGSVETVPVYRKFTDENTGIKYINNYVKGRLIAKGTQGAPTSRLGSDSVQTGSASGFSADCPRSPWTRCLIVTFVFLSR